VTLAKRLNKESESLSCVNNELLEANKMIQDSIEHITSLYQSVNNLVNIKDRNRLASIVVDYTKQITKSNAFSYIHNGENQYVFQGKGSIG
jgi:uncharacterized protein YfkK (UPF0435 family)